MPESQPQPFANADKILAQYKAMMKTAGEPIKPIGQDDFDNSMEASRALTAAQANFAPHENTYDKTRADLVAAKKKYDAELGAQTKLQAAEQAYNAAVAGYDPNAIDTTRRAYEAVAAANNPAWIRAAEQAYNEQIYDATQGANDPALVTDDVRRNYDAAVIARARLQTTRQAYDAAVAADRLVHTTRADYDAARAAHNPVALQTAEQQYNLTVAAHAPADQARTELIAAKRRYTATGNLIESDSSVVDVLSPVTLKNAAGDLVIAQQEYKRVVADLLAANPSVDLNANPTFQAATRHVEDALAVYNRTALVPSDNPHREIRLDLGEDSLTEQISANQARQQNLIAFREGVNAMEPQRRENIRTAEERLLKTYVNFMTETNSLDHFQEFVYEGDKANIAAVQSAYEEYILRMAQDALSANASRNKVSPAAAGDYRVIQAVDADANAAIAEVVLEANNLPVDLNDQQRIDFLKSQGITYEMFLKVMSKLSADFRNKLGLRLLERCYEDRLYTKLVEYLTDDAFLGTDDELFGADLVKRLMKAYTVEQEVDSTPNRLSLKQALKMATFMVEHPGRYVAGMNADDLKDFNAEWTKEEIIIMMNLLKDNLVDIENSVLLTGEDKRGGEYRRYTVAKASVIDAQSYVDAIKAHKGNPDRLIEARNRIADQCIALCVEILGGQNYDSKEVLTELYRVIDFAEKQGMNIESFYKKMEAFFISDKLSIQQYNKLCEVYEEHRRHTSMIERINAEKAAGTIDDAKAQALLAQVGNNTKWEGIKVQLQAMDKADADKK